MLNAMLEVRSEQAWHSALVWLLYEQSTVVTTPDFIAGRHVFDIHSLQW